MGVLRWFEAVSGVLAGLAGGAAVVYFLTAPTYSTAGCSIATPGEPPICTTGTETLIQVNGAHAVVLLSLVAALSLGVAVSAVWHSRTSRSGARRMLWFCALVLTLLAVASLPSIGVFLLPSVVLALIACACSFGRWPAVA